MPLSSDSRGLFILPEETASDYHARIQPMMRAFPGFESARKKMKELFACDPSWVEVFYSKKELYPWEAACTWYDEIPSIQLRPHYEKNSRLFGLYDKDEVLAHEYVHAVRAAFNSDRFEEIFAYLTSPSYRRVIGPLFQKPWEVLFFLIALFGLIAMGYFWLAALVAFLFCVRLGLRSMQFWRSYWHLSKLTTKVLPLMIRLTDDEIVQFSQQSPDEISQYIASQQCFRWQLLSQNYLLR